MKDVPRVSVVIPTYNAARFLPEAIDSILAQTVPAHEIIVVDDGSTDDTAQVLQRYGERLTVLHQDFEILFLDDASTDDSAAVFARFAGEERIRAFYNEENSGSPFRQWNRGVRMARGAYIWIAESDDYAHPEFLRSAGHALRF